MSQFQCKYCLRPMKVSFLEYKSNAYCNECFNDRASAANLNDNPSIELFEFMGESFELESPTKDKDPKV